MNIVVEPHYDEFLYYMITLNEPTDSKDPWFINEYQDTDKWCEETFGAQDLWGQEPVTGWKRMRNRYYFVSESSRELFVLRWS